MFASRFDNTGDANQNKWIFGGQSRGNGGSGPNVPSLNIHTEQDAENPSVAGGSAVDATKPGPWVTWQETANSNHQDQIFVSRPLGPGQANCDGVTPAGVADATGHVPAIGGFCFQQTGIPRVGTAGADPSLNVDPTRNGVEPDIAFTGNANAVQDSGSLGGVVRKGQDAITRLADSLTTTRWCSPPRACSDGVGRQRRLSLGRGRQSGQRHARHDRHQPFRRVRRVGHGRGASAR